MPATQVPLAEGSPPSFEPRLPAAEDEEASTEEGAVDAAEHHGEAEEGETELRVKRKGLIQRVVERMTAAKSVTARNAVYLRTRERFVCVPSVPSVLSPLCLPPEVFVAMSVPSFAI